MIKKILSFMMVLLIGLSLVACNEDIDPLEVTIDLTTENVTIIEGETYQIDSETNDILGLLFVSGDAEVVSVDINGLVTAVGEGETIISVSSKTDASVSVDISITVRKIVSLSADVESITLTEDDTHLVVVTSNDEYVYSSSNMDIFVVDEDGLITAKEEGIANLIITSTYDETVEIIIPVTVERLVVITVVQDTFVMVVGDTNTIDATANDDLVYESRNPDVATVDTEGNLEAVRFGEATITVTSVLDDEVSVEVTITVYKFTEEIEITGNNILITGMNGVLNIDPSPVGAYTGVTWESSDSSVVTVDEYGVTTGIAIGTASIIATSILDSEIVDTYEIEVINVTVVDGTKQVGETYDYMGVDLVYGERLFSEIGEAITNSPVGTIIYISAGLYQENLLLNIDEITLEGISDVIIEGVITVTANNVTINNIKFQGASSIFNSSDISDFVFTNNVVEDITVATDSFLKISGIENIIIADNSFTNLANSAIRVEDFISGLILIEGNVIDGAGTAIAVDATREYDIVTEINILWNDINDVTTGFIVDLMYGENQKQIEAIVRFNATSDYVIAAYSNVGNQVDFTLNYWGVETMDYTKFNNVDEFYLRGFYTLEEHIITEEDYNPSLPVVIIVNNPITEITIGETHTFEYSVLPMELDSPNIKYITSTPSILAINQSGIITPLTSGTATITVRSGYDSSIKTVMTINVITTPGVEIVPSVILNTIIVGDTFTLDTIVFPVRIESEAVSFSSDNSAVATIDSFGNVITLSEGLVTFTASLDSDPTVSVDYTVYIYSSLDDTNLLDYLTMNQVSYSTSHSWTAYGFEFNYADTRYESVSRYYFEDSLPINDSKLVPVSYGIRPGALMEPLTTGLTQFNPENIYWVVVHDTASTKSGSGALAHANYLYNNAIAENALWVSWHYTIDDTYIYQSLPENERGYHAGDGSSLADQGYVKNGITYLGGGNRNGIGIEMAVNQDGDMYRTWQRTAKLVVDILTRNNMPITQYKYHNDYTGKDCPNTLRNAGLIPLFETFVEVEYKIATMYPNATIVFESNDPNYLDNHGRIIAMPERAITVSYTITVTEDGITTDRTFYTYLPGTVR